ncbi:MAG: pirin family protein [Tannerella sp.]|jgi:redox-sensitive bicupin YhaK (pirin superfamily)|nr:pirin family protein [Tannerella sp.]
MKTVLYRSSTRGHKNHGWLDTYHTFSFADYYNTERMHFGALRVINDDIVEGGKEFDTQPHDNMEFVLIPLYGKLKYKDCTGHTRVIGMGEVQVMSTGTDVCRSECNAHADRPVNFLQIGIFPNKENVKPRSGQKALDFISRNNQLVELVSPDQKGDGLWLHQDAWIHMGTFDRDYSLEYQIKKAGNGVWAMVIEGEFTVEDKHLFHRDGFGLWDVDRIKITSASDDARILLIDIPMDF